MQPSLQHDFAETFPALNICVGDNLTIVPRLFIVVDSYVKTLNGL